MKQMVKLGFAITGICLLAPVGAQTIIHRCSDADGNIVFSQLPCETEESDESEEIDSAAQPETAAEVQTEVLEPDQAEREYVVADGPIESRSEEEVAACKKRYRDAIDAIEAEMAGNFSSENAEQYKERLLALTRQLRQC